MRLKSSLLILLFTVACLNIQAQDALSIVKKLDANLVKIKDKKVNVEMTMTNLKSGKEKIKKAELYQKGNSKKLFRYTYPESDAGISTLTLPNNEVYLYLPMFNKPKKITNMAESNAFNKSDFSINDMATSGYVNSFELTLMDPEGEDYKVLLIPKDEKSPYTKLVLHINKTYFYRDKIEFYTKSEMHKFALYHHIKVNGVWVADEVSMEDVKKNHKTTLKMSDIQVNKNLDDSIFTLENLVPSK